MPIYVYKNLTTGERFEIEQRITEPPLEEHPETGDPVKRLVQPVGIAFKGSGFYATDSRSATKSSQPASGADASVSDSGSKDATSASGSSSGSGSTESTSKETTKAPKASNG